MKKSTIFILTIVFALNGIMAQDKIVTVNAFDKIIVSPHITVNLVEGDEEKVVIDNAKVEVDKIHVEVEGNTLRLYLEGAKVVTQSERISNDQWQGSRPLYSGTMATATVTYKTLKNLSVRGEEMVHCKSPIKGGDFKMSLYGETKVYVNLISVDKLTCAIYGSSYLEIGKGDVKKQVYRAYGESEVNAVGMHAAETKITAYGESNFRVNVSDRLKVTCYGETNVNYTGNAQVDRGIIIGEAKVRKIG